MATTYTWEFGVDWDAFPSAGLRYLRQGLVDNRTGRITPLHVQPEETIGVKIFDVSLAPLSSEAGNRIKSFSIIIKPADFALTSPQGDPFDLLQITFLREAACGCSTVFITDPTNNPPLPVWLPDPTLNPKTYLTAKTPGRFLVSFLVQAAGPDPATNYIFAHDPEMIVGSNGP